MNIRLIRHRNTPTGVGKTDSSDFMLTIKEKHPHGRGEDEPAPLRMVPVPETPPRAWGRPKNRWLSGRARRNTPTGVGKTARVSGCTCTTQKHPHGRGEDAIARTAADIDSETPPRAWGRRDGDDPLALPGGNTPTGVGKTRDHSKRRD